MSEEGGGGGGHGGPVWLLTYCDLITLLVAFFVMLISFATINVDKCKKEIPKISESFDAESWSNRFQGLFDEGTMEKTNKPFPGKAGGDYLLEDGQKPEEQLMDSKEMHDYISDFAAGRGMKDYVDIEDVKIGCKVKIPVDACFEKGKPALKREALLILGNLAILMREFWGKIVIDANVGKYVMVDGDLKQETDLSIERAANICNYLVTKEEIEPVRVAIAGYHTTTMSDSNVISIIIFKR